MKIADENHPMEEMIKKKLTELLEEYYNGSFPQMACEYICTTGMTKEEAEELLEAMKGSHARAINNKVEYLSCTSFSTFFMLYDIF